MWTSGRWNVQTGMARSQGAGGLVKHQPGEGLLKVGTAGVPDCGSAEQQGWRAQGALKKELA